MFQMDAPIGICIYARMKEKKRTFANQIKEAVIALFCSLGCKKNVKTVNKLCSFVDSALDIRKLLQVLLISVYPCDEQ